MSRFAELRFFPWLRRGLAQSITEVALTNGKPRNRHASITASVTMDGKKITQNLTLQGPGEVIGIHARQILRVEPRNRAKKFESNYFPFVEFSAPDLPWMFTPAKARGNDQLRPWLVLVVVRQQEGVSVDNIPTRPLPTLSIQSPAVPDDELPDLSQSWAWAHVQMSPPQNDEQTPAQLLEQQPERFLSRLICPRNLAANTAYIACLVPAFKTGVETGLGAEPATEGALEDAWSTGEAGVDLPVYYSWTFETGKEGDFETLARKLTPRELDSGVGLHALDISAPGGGLIEQEGIEVDFAGALVSPSAKKRQWPKGHQQKLQQQLRRMLNVQAVERAAVTTVDYQALRDDPVVTPPLYGALQTGKTGLDGKSPPWLEELNLDPALRVVAGLGVETIRHNQEEIMASAWKQSEELREINQKLNQAQLAAKTGEKLKLKINRLPEGALIQFTRPAHARLKYAGQAQTVYGQVARSEMPDGLASASFQKITRHGTAVAKALRTFEIDTSVSDTLVSRVIHKPASILGFADFKTPDGMQNDDEQTVDEIGSALSGDSAPSKSSAKTSVKASAKRDFNDTHRAAIPKKFNSDQSLKNLSNAIKTGLDPATAILASLKHRITAPQSLWTGEGIPKAMFIEPTFPDPVYELLTELAPDYLMPGVGDIEDNSISLLEVNAAFVEAYLSGMNHELSREFLWREFPARLNGTWFRQFWDTQQVDQPDIGPIAQWQSSLGAHQIGAGGDSTLVLLIKGELLRRYPGVIIYATQAHWRGAKRLPRARENKKQPLFRGELANGVSFLGFDLTLDQARGSKQRGDRDAGWFFVLEERPSEPRFGLDEAEDSVFGTAPTDWNDLSWAHFAQDAAALEALSHADLQTLNGLSIGNAGNANTWGAHASDMARITLQKPVRLVIHADAMLPG